MPSFRLGLGVNRFTVLNWSINVRCTVGRFCSVCALCTVHRDCGPVNDTAKGADRHILRR